MASPWSIDFTVPSRARQRDNPFIDVPSCRKQRGTGPSALSALELRASAPFAQLAAGDRVPSAYRQSALAPWPPALDIARTRRKSRTDTVGKNNMLLDGWRTT